MAFCFGTELMQDEFSIVSGTLGTVVPGFEVKVCDDVAEGFRYVF